jgi:hypothetical protein
MLINGSALVCSASIQHHCQTTLPNGVRRKKGRKGEREKVRSPAFRYSNLSPSKGKESSKSKEKTRDNKNQHITKRYPLYEMRFYTRDF